MSIGNIIFTIIFSVLATVCMPLFMYRAERRMAEIGNDSADPVDFVTLVSESRVVISMIALVLIGFLNGISLTFGGGLFGQIASWVLIAMDVAIFVYLCIFWYQHHENKDEGKQLIPVMGIVFFATMLLIGAVWRAIDLCKVPQPFVALLWSVIITAPIFTIGYCICWIFGYRAETEDDDVKKAKCERIRTTSWWSTIVIVVLVFLIVFLPALISSLTAFTAAAAKEARTDSAVSTKATNGNGSQSGSESERKWLLYDELVKKHSWLTWNNFTLQSDGDPDNNANFGPDRHHKGWTATDYFQDMKTFDESDVLILTAHVAAVDAARDTRMVGDYYDGNNHDWARTMNTMIEACLSDKVNFMHFSEVYLNMLKYEVRNVRVVHMDDINDQMYITPYTYSGVPELVASETHQSGDVLIVTFKRKGGEENDVSVGFRIDCCYQPVGVIDLMKLPNTKVEIPPEHTETTTKPLSTNPNNQPSTDPDNPPSPTTTPGPGPDPTDPTSAVKQKNPADDPVNNGNAQKGGGDNKSSDGSGEYQKEDPRTEKQDSADVKPETPAVVPEHKADQDSGKVVDHENKMDYTPDPVTNRGSVNGKPATSKDGDGEYTPPD